jgi:hypothetical protein
MKPHELILKHSGFSPEEVKKLYENVPEGEVTDEELEVLCSMFPPEHHHHQSSQDPEKDLTKN